MHGGWRETSRRMNKQLVSKVDMQTSCISPTWQKGMVSNVMHWWMQDLLGHFTSTINQCQRSGQCLGILRCNGREIPQLLVRELVPVCKVCKGSIQAHQQSPNLWAYLEKWGGGGGGFRSVSYKKR